MAQYAGRLGALGGETSSEVQNLMDPWCTGGNVRQGS